MVSGLRWSLVCLLVLRAPVVGAAPPGPDPGAAEDDKLARAGELINQGQDRFDTADFDGAIDLWTQAYAMLPDAPDYAAARNLLAYQIAHACAEAYNLKPDVTYLRKADRLLTQYLEGLDPAETEARAEGEKLRDEVRARLPPEPTTTPPPEPAPERPPPAPAPRPTPPPHDVRPLQLGGGIATAVGVLALVGTAASAGLGAGIDREGRMAVASGASDPELDELLARGTRANQAAIGTAVVGVALITTGVSLFALAEARKRRNVGLAPGPGVVGLALRARF